MKQNVAKWLMLFLSGLFLVTGILLSGQRQIGGFRGAGTEKWKAKKGQILAQISFDFFRWETLILKWSEEENKYYLFLPSFWKEGDKVRFFDASGRVLGLDGRELSASGQAGMLTSGMHELTVDGEAYGLEVLASENLPSVFLSMENETWDAVYQIPYQNQSGAGMLVIKSDGEIEAAGEADGFRVRGNSSADWVKKPYQITLARPMDLFGMGEAVKWNLLSNWSDATLLRNTIAYEMAEEAGMPYSPESTLVDLYINGEYQGNYQLCEKVEIGKNRVDLANLENDTIYVPSEEEQDMQAVKELSKEDPAAAGIKTLENGVSYRGYQAQLMTDDISGGYLLEIERMSRIYENPSFFITAKGQPVTVKRPKYADESEVIYIAGIWQAFEDALYAEDGRNAGSGLHYSDYIDLESFVKKYLVEEIVRNYDASSTSQYFYKDRDVRDQKLFAGPVWDYDMSLGNPKMNPETNQNYISSVSPYGLFAALPMDEFSLWYRLYEKEDFRKAVYQSYEKDFLPYLKKLMDTRIDELAEYTAASAMMDEARWGKGENTSQKERKENYLQNIEKLKEFIRIREHYLTGLWLDRRESKKVYLNGGNADMYISYVEGLVGDVLEEPIPPEMEGYTFVQWLDGYTKEPYDFTQPYDGSDLFFTAEYICDADGSILIAGE